MSPIPGEEMIVTSVCCAVPLSHVQLLATPQTVACLPVSCVYGDFLGKNTGVGLPCPPPRDLPNTGIEPGSPVLQADSLPSEPPRKSKNTGVCSLSLLGELPDRGIEPGSPQLQADSLLVELPGKPITSVITSNHQKS